MKIISLIFFPALVLLLSCGSTKVEMIKGNDECNSNILIRKYKRGLFGKQTGGEKAEKGSYFDIYFTEGFHNDEIKAYINGKLLFHKIISTDESLGTTGIGFQYIWEDKTKPLILKVIKNGNKKYCLKMELDKSFRQLFITSKETDWEVIYDDVYPLYQ